MASSTYVLKEHDNITDVTYSLVGNTAEGAIYRVSSRTLALPQSVELQMKIGAPGAKGNDHVKVIFKNVVRNSTTGAIFTGSASLDVSVPRDASWTDDDTKDLMAFVANYLVSANRVALSDGVVP